jgi:tetratricopeptide (TPR) repeat protein
MNSSARTAKQRLPLGRLASLLVFTGILAIQAVGSVWSIFAYTNQSNATLGVDDFGADWHSLSSVIRNGGYRVSGVYPAGPAGRAGLRDGDLVVEVNGRSVADHPDAYWGPLNFAIPGDTLALAWIHGGDPAEAMKQATVLDGLDSLAGAYAWASIWESAGDFEQAAAAYRRAVARDTSSTDRARYRFGLFLMRAEEYGAAAAILAEVLARHPDDLIVLYQVGKVDLFMKRNLDEAIRCFRRCLDEAVPIGGPSPAMTHYRLGQVYDLQGNRDSALAELRRAVALQPGAQEISQVLQGVERRK